MGSNISNSVCSLLSSTEEGSIRNTPEQRVLKQNQIVGDKELAKLQETIAIGKRRVFLLRQEKGRAVLSKGQFPKWINRNKDNAK